MLGLHTGESEASVFVQFSSIVSRHWFPIIIPGDSGWRMTSDLYPQVHLLPLSGLYVTRELHYTRLCREGRGEILDEQTVNLHTDSYRMLQHIQMYMYQERRKRFNLSTGLVLTDSFFYCGRGFSVGFLEGGLIRHGSRRWRSLGGSCVLGLVLTHLPVHTPYYT